MPTITSGLREPGQPDPEITVCITIPEEFSGSSMSELERRHGCLTDMKVQHGLVSVRATLPASAFGGLVEAIGLATQRQGRVEAVTGSE